MMRPVLFSVPVGGALVRFPAYGAFVALGFVLGIGLFLRSGRREGFDTGRLQDLAFSSVVLGLVGSRVAFVLVNARAFIGACWPGGHDAAVDWVRGGCWAPLRFWDGGLVFYGGAAAVGAVLWSFGRREGWSLLRLGDLAAPSVALGHAVGRIGCLMAGCCYGRACGEPWAIRFGPGSVAFDDALVGGRLGPGAVATAPLHPTQIYEALGELAIFVGLVMLRRRWAAAGHPGSVSPGSEAAATARAAAPATPGRLLGVYLLAYALLRFGVELFRGDASRGFLFRWAPPAVGSAVGLGPHDAIVLSTSQAVSLLLGAAAAVGLARRRARKPAGRAIPR